MSIKPTLIFDQNIPKSNFGIALAKKVLESGGTVAILSMEAEINDEKIKQYAERFFKPKD